LCKKSCGKVKKFHKKHLTNVKKYAAKPLLKITFLQGGSSRMNEFVSVLKSTLFGIITKMAESPNPFVNSPDKDFTRKRKLPFDDVLKIVVSMGGNSINKELMEAYDYDTQTATTSAFIQQRDKIKPSAFEHLSRKFTGTFKDLVLYKGFRLLAADGSDLHTPTNPNDAETYIKNRPDDRGHNIFYLNALYDLLNRIYVDANIKTKRAANERAALEELIGRSDIQENVIVTADRGFEGYNTFAHFEKKGWNYVIRVKDIDSNGILSKLQLPKSGAFDLTLRLILTKRNTKEIRANPGIYKRLPLHTTFDFLDKDENQFYPITLRAVCFILSDGSYNAVITNLPEEDFTTEEIKRIYSQRWGIETSFRKLKHTIGLNNFHSAKPEHIKQEIFARIIMYNFVERVVSRTIISKGRKQHIHQVNFTAATLVCRRYLRIGSNLSPHDAEVLISKNTVPVRPERKSPCKPKFRTAVAFTYRAA
jgi:hypothetical protein